MHVNECNLIVKCYQVFAINDVKHCRLLLWNCWTIPAHYKMINKPVIKKVVLKCHRYVGWCSSVCTCMQTQTDLWSYRPFKKIFTQLINLPIHTDHAQCHYWSRTAHDIHPNKDVAENLPKQPDASCQISHYDKRHDCHRHGQVRYGKRH